MTKRIAHDEVTLEIDAPPAQVYDLISDITRSAPVGALAGRLATHALGAGTTILASGIATSVLGVLALVVVRPISSPHPEPMTAPLAGLPA